MYAPVANADGRGIRIDPAPISAANLNVDFDDDRQAESAIHRSWCPGAKPTSNSASARLRASRSRKVDCEGVANCSTATLDFYGKDATHAGVLLKVSYDRVMPQADWVAAHLTNVFGQAAIALWRRDVVNFPASPVIRQR